MHTALYARVSTERQERQQTIDSQLAALRAWAVSGNHAVAEEHVFRDEGYSGSRLDRPGLDALRDAVRDGAVQQVVVLTPDRLARKYAYQVLLLEEFRRAGVEVVFLQHPISDDPNDQLLLQIQGAIAEYERAVLGERFRRGKMQRAQRALPRGPGALRLPLCAAPRRHSRAPRRGRGRGGAGADALRLAGRGADNHPPDPQAPERRPLAAALGPARLVAVHGAPYPGRPGLCRHGVCQPLRLCASRQAARPARPTHRRGDQAVPQAARPVDRHPGAGAGRAGHLGPCPSAAGPQRRALVPQQCQAQLHAALPAHLRGVRPGHVRRHPPGNGDKARPAVLRVPRQGLRAQRAHRRLPQPQRQGRGHRTLGVGPRRRPALRPGPAAGAVRPPRSRRRGRLHPGPGCRAAAAHAAGPDHPGRQAPAGRLPGRCRLPGRTIRATSADRRRAPGPGTAAAGAGAAPRAPPAHRGGADGPGGVLRPHPRAPERGGVRRQADDLAARRRAHHRWRRQPGNTPCHPTPPAAAARQ